MRKKVIWVVAAMFVLRVFMWASRTMHQDTAAPVASRSPQYQWRVSRQFKSGGFSYDFADAEYDAARGAIAFHILVRNDADTSAAAHWADVLTVHVGDKKVALGNDPPPLEPHHFVRINAHLKVDRWPVTLVFANGETLALGRP